MKNLNRRFNKFNFIKSVVIKTVFAEQVLSSLTSVLLMLAQDVCPDVRRLSLRGLAHYAHLKKTQVLCVVLCEIATLMPRGAVGAHPYHLVGNVDTPVPPGGLCGHTRTTWCLVCTHGLCTCTVLTAQCSLTCTSHWLVIISTAQCSPECIEYRKVDSILRSVEEEELG